MQPDGSEGGSRRDALLARLEAARRGEADLAGADLRGVRLVGADLSGLDLSGADLSGADLSRCDLTGTNLFRARLRDTVLYEAVLERAELSGADLGRADLRRARASGAGLGHARLEAARLSEALLEGATLTGADLTGAELRLARMRGARVREATLRHAELRGADMQHVELDGSALEGADLDGADLRHASLVDIRDFQSASWIGADIRDLKLTGAHLCRRFILDQNYLEEFRRRDALHEVIYKVWWVTSDCGRSAGRWALWTLYITVLFSGIYSFVEVDYGEHETFLSPLYYSVVTITTLGYGDVLPRSVAAQSVAMFQVVIGYVMLGGLLSIFSNKMARRAD
jgi:uncharacterized protein YjbI with pentapeptide repeats